jgi:hypothetical protein
MYRFVSTTLSSASRMTSGASNESLPPWQQIRVRALERVRLGSEAEGCLLLEPFRRKASAPSQPSCRSLQETMKGLAFPFCFYLNISHIKQSRHSRVPGLFRLRNAWNLYATNLIYDLSYKNRNPCTTSV